MSQDVAAEAPPTDGPVTGMVAPIRLEYRIGAGRARSQFLRGLTAGEFRGQRCPVCTMVYVPPKGICPTCAVFTDEEIVLPHTGTVTTFCVVNIKFSPRAPELPYVCGQVLLDGANTPLLGLIAGIPARQVRMGLRVRAAWVDPAERQPTMESVKWFEPTGEPDADFETYREYL